MWWYNECCDLGFEVIVRCNTLLTLKEQSRAWEAITFSATQEIPHMFEAQRFISVFAGAHP